ncbi:TetR/AcrR family transcriptional regulator [Agromyces sp. PvR057]|uniref:TetR/AcrR family transcriptional regulator n=1 Tax=Agromyces sp. PvR057 TaxID=3156403 RepID=UPI000E27E1EB
MSTGNYAKGLRRRDAIVEAATEVFARAGFDGASIVEIAADVGISRAGLLHHFESKEELLMAVLDQREASDRQVFLASGSRREGGIGVLRGMVRLAQRNEERPGLVRLYVALSAEATAHDHPAHRYFVEHYTRILEGTTHALRSARELGALRPEIDPDRFATDLVALQDGLQLQWLLRPERARIAAPLEAFIQSALTRDLWAIVPDVDSGVDRPRGVTTSDSNPPLEG